MDKRVISYGIAIFIASCGFGVWAAGVYHGLCLAVCQ